MHGYTGNILRVNLTDRTVSTIETKKYESWGGGHGIGSAIFFDLVQDKAISGLDPQNVVTIMTSPLSGTPAPAVAGRTEVQAIGLQPYPTEWFTRGNFGGRFSGMLKFAGWDGIVIEGKADKPVWVDIRNNKVEIRDASSLWGLDTWKTQESIWQYVGGNNEFTDWHEVQADNGRSTQRPAVLTIGRAGERKSRVAALVHDAGDAVGQGGFGGVWGSKNLKAISVIGSGSVSIADPKALVEARIWAKKNYAFQLENLKPPPFASFGGHPGKGYRDKPDVPARMSGCLGCHAACRRRTATSGNDSSCVGFAWYSPFDMEKHGRPTQATPQAADLLQQAGINCLEILTAIIWLRVLSMQGIVGPGKPINTDLDFSTLGEVDFVKQLVTLIETKQGIGADLSEGVARAAKKWGRLEEDLSSGLLNLQYWGYPQHYDARIEAEWGYGSILGDRDCNEHDFNVPCYWIPSMAALTGQPQLLSAKELSEIIAEKCAPYHDPKMIDYSDEGIYSESMTKTVAWHRHYTRFWKQSIAYCDVAYADFVNQYRPDKRGLTPEGEPKFFNAVTGKNIIFEDGMEIGRKIWNLDRAIWALQGRHRDQEKFAPYTYDKAPDTGTPGIIPYTMPVCENGTWSYKTIQGRKLDRQKVEAWKTKYYKLEGWDPASGRPTEKTLKDLGLSYVAEELKKNNKLGKG